MSQTDHQQIWTATSVWTVMTGMDSLVIAASNIIKYWHDNRDIFSSIHTVYFYVTEGEDKIIFCIYIVGGFTFKLVLRWTNSSKFTTVQTWLKTSSNDGVINENHEEGIEMNMNMGSLTQTTKWEWVIFQSVHNRIFLFVSALSCGEGKIIKELSQWVCDYCSTGLIIVYFE